MSLIFPISRSSSDMHVVQHAPILNIPNELIFYILKNLHVEGIGHLEQSCRSFRMLLQEDESWKIFYQRDFSWIDKDPSLNFKNAYRKCYILFCNLKNALFSYHRFSNLPPNQFLFVTSAKETLFLGGMDGTVYAYDPVQRNCRKLFKHDRQVSRLAAQGGIVLTSSGDQEVHAWDLKTGKPMGSLSSPGEFIQAVIFGPREKVVTGSTDGIKNWDFVSGKFFPVLEENMNVSSLAAKDNKLYIGTLSGTILVRDLIGETVTPLLGHSQAVTSLAFLDGHLVSGSFDETMMIWNLQTSECVLEIGGFEGGLIGLSTSNGTIYTLSGTNQLSSIDFLAPDTDILEGIALSIRRGLNANDVLEKMPKKVRERIFEIFAEDQGGLKEPEQLFKDSTNNFAKARAVERHLAELKE